LEASIRKMIDAQQLIRAHTSTLDNLRQKLARGEKLTNLAEKYRTGVGDVSALYGQKTTRQKYGREEGYFKFREGIWQGLNGDDNPMPPDFVTQDLDREQGDPADDSDEEIAIGGQTQLLKCPLTLRFLTSALTSKKCKHSYSSEAIKQYLADGRGPKHCPATGCDQYVSIEDLEENRQLERMARRAEQAEREREQGLDEDGIEDVDESLVM